MGGVEKGGKAGGGRGYGGWIGGDRNNSIADSCI